MLEAEKWWMLKSHTLVPVNDGAESELANLIDKLTAIVPEQPAMLPFYKVLEEVREKPLPGEES